MSVPLDRLYEFLQALCNHHDVLIYRYFPHGSTKIENCLPLNNQLSGVPKIKRFDTMYSFFHDQEPIRIENFPQANGQLPGVPFHTYRMLASNYLNRYDKVIVAHSELHSDMVMWLEATGCVPVYWWSHALIAMDWFRYARVDPVLKVKNTDCIKDFLIYNRAWQGSREYRLKFSELIVNNELQDFCNMNFNAVDQYHYREHKFVNPALTVVRTDLENHLQANSASSDASADYNCQDYTNSHIEVVLETLFDDSRWHLTEKSLRPIACGQPFILAGTAGSLEYLRSYGFRTFSPWIDESYDNIKDPVLRLQAIVRVMKNIAALPPQQKQDLLHKLGLVAEYNKKRFWSQEFFDLVVNEFVTNFDSAAKTMKQHQQGTYFKFRLQHGLATATKEEILTMIKMLKKPIP